MMKRIVQLLLVISLATASLAASTAYHVRLDLPDERLVDLTLADDAGRRVMPDGQQEPLLEKGRKLTRHDLELLRDNDVALVRVSEFSVRRWPGLTLFSISAVVMVACAFLTKRWSKTRPAAGEASGSSSSVDLLRAIETAVASLVDQVDQAGKPAAQLRLIVPGLSAIGQDQVQAFADSRSELIDDIGLGHAAEVIGRLATAERQLNRAWSAAADGHTEEAVNCLRAARELFRDTARLMDEYQPHESSS